MTLFTFLLAYLLRVFTIRKRTISIGPFILWDSQLPERKQSGRSDYPRRLRPSKSIINHQSQSTDRLYYHKESPV